MISAQVLGGKPLDVAYTSTATIGPVVGPVGPTAVNYTFTAVPIGAETATRLVVIGITMTASSIRDISALTIGGIAATRIVSTSTPDTVASFLWSAVVPTGTTANVVLTTTSATTTFRFSLTCWTIKRLRSATAVGSGSSIASPGTVTVATSSGGVLVALASNLDNDSTFTWGAAGKDYETNTTAGGVVSRSGFHATTGPATVTVSYAPAASSPRLVAASFR